MTDQDWKDLLTLADMGFAAQTQSLLSQQNSVERVAALSNRFRHLLELVEEHRNPKEPIDGNTRKRQPKRSSRKPRNGGNSGDAAEHSVASGDERPEK